MPDTAAKACLDLPRIAAQSIRELRTLCGCCFELAAQAEAAIEALALAEIVGPRAVEIVAVLIAARAESLTALHMRAFRAATSNADRQAQRARAERYALLASDLRSLLRTTSAPGTGLALTNEETSA